MPAATSLATSSATTIPTDSVATLATLDALDVPPRNAVDLALEYGKTTSAQRVARTQPLTDTVGTKTTFWVLDKAKNRYVARPATLQLVLDHVLMYVQDGIRFDPSALTSSAHEFNDKIYVRDRELFGAEWSPGVDGDPRITIFNGVLGGGVAGYFYSNDEVPRTVNSYSNEREMFYMDIEYSPFGSRDYGLTLAHEFQHMIEWHEAARSESWFDEGLSVLAQDLNGYGPGGYPQTFLAKPDTQLTDFADDPSTLPHYGASYLFLAYFYERYGRVLDPRQLIHSGAGDHLNVFADAAHKLRSDVRSFDDLFADWAVANLVDDPGLEQGRWSYSRLPRAVKPEAQTQDEIKGAVAQYGADYLLLPQASADRVITFDGSDTVGVVAAAPEGHVSWWSNRGDDIASTLTGHFDLTKVRSATLNFRLWYDTEKDYDYGFVSASIDGGKTWRTLRGRFTTDEDRFGHNFDHGYTGQSATSAPGWEDESLDLTPFAGHMAMIRFSMITDDETNRPGMLVDNIRIPEISFFDDVEHANNAWQSAGWVRTDNRLPQQWEVRLIHPSQASSGHAKVDRISLDSANRATIHIPAGERDVLVIMATTPHTTERASFSLSPSAEPVTGSSRRPSAR